MEIVSELTNNNIRAKKQFKIYTHASGYQRTIGTQLTLYAIGILTVLGMIILVGFMIVTVVPFMVTSWLIKSLPNEEPCKNKLVSNSEHIKQII